MNSRAWKALSLFLVAMLLPSCPGRRTSSVAWIPRHAPWPDREVSSYDVLKDDSLVGKAVFQIRANEAKGRKVYELIGVNSSVRDAASMLHDSVVALLTRDSLKSVSTFQVGNMLVRMDSVTTQYSRYRVTVASRTGSQAVAADQNTFDNSILVMAIRTLDLKPGAHYLLGSLAAFGPWVKPADIEVLGDETLSVPAGSFICRKVALQMAGWTMQLWYERNPPHRYVKFENRNNNSQAVLTGYESAGSQ